MPVRALLSTLELSVPAGLDFGLCATRETSSRTFYVTNVGQVPAPFSWSVPDPFSFEPKRGVVGVGESFAIVARLEPRGASVLVARATCDVGLGCNAIKPMPLLELSLSAIGKFAHVTLSEERLDFGEVLAGTPFGEDVTRELTVCNRSVVPASVHVRRVEQDRDPCYFAQPDQFIVPPQGEIVVRITFLARAAGTYSADHLDFVTPGGNAPRVLLTGAAVSPDVKVYKKEDPYALGLGVPNSVNFGSVKVGDGQTRAFFLQNKSERPLNYQFLLEKGGSFSVSKPQGILPAKFKTHTHTHNTQSGVFKSKDIPPREKSLLRVLVRESARARPLSLATQRRHALA